MSVNIKTMTPSEYVELKKQPTKDCTIDGQCSSCGACCSAVIPMTKDEARQCQCPTINRIWLG